MIRSYLPLKLEFSRIFLHRKWLKKVGLNPVGCSWSTWNKEKLSVIKKLKEKISSEQDYAGWLDQSLLDSDHLPDCTLKYSDDFDSIITRQKAFGFTFEDLGFLIGPSAQSGKQPLGSMGNDSPWRYYPTNHNSSTIISSNYLLK